MDLYQAILERRSVRRYQQDLLDKAMLAQIDEVVDNVTPLVPENRFRVMRRDVFSGEDLIAAMGSYGRVVSPPHYLVASGVGEAHLLTDIAFRMEQIAVRLTRIGLATCFIGSLERRSDVRIRFRLSREAIAPAFLLFGYPASGVGGRAINAVIRSAAGSANKHAAEDIFFEQSFENPTAPSSRLAKLIEAARHAPSCKNAQPWRFMWHDETLYLFVLRDNPRYGKHLGAKDYRFFDGGLCMANVTLAMQALDIKGQWSLLHGVETEIPHHPQDVQALAKLRLD